MPRPARAHRTRATDSTASSADQCDTRDTAKPCRCDGRNRSWSSRCDYSSQAQRTLRDCPRRSVDALDQLAATSDAIRVPATATSTAMPSQAYPSRQAHLPRVNATCAARRSAFRPTRLPSSSAPSTSPRDMLNRATPPRLFNAPPCRLDATCPSRRSPASATSELEQNRFRRSPASATSSFITTRTIFSATLARQASRPLLMPTRHASSDRRRARATCRTSPSRAVLERLANVIPHGPNPRDMPGPVGPSLSDSRVRDDPSPVV